MSTKGWVGVPVGKDAVTVKTHPLFPRDLSIVYTYQALHDQIKHFSAVLGRELLRSPKAQEFEGSPEVLGVCDLVGVTICEPLEVRSSSAFSCV